MKTDSVQLNPSIIQEIGLPLGDSSGILNHVMDVMSVLSKNDALTIFLMAGKGIKSELDTPTKIGLTKKQYYTRLKQLVDLGLLVKHGDSYTQTAFGKSVYDRHFLGLTNSIKNAKYYEMVDALKANSKFSDAEIIDFISKVDNQTDINLDETAKRKSILAFSFDEMVNKVLETTEFAQHEILLISRFQSEVIINSILQKASKGVSVKVLADASLVDGYFTKEPGTTKPDKNKNERVKVVADPYYPSRVERRYADAPFCVLIVDKKHVGIELVDSTKPKEFKMALFVEDKNLASSMIPFFEKAWKVSHDAPKIISKSA